VIITRADGATFADLVFSLRDGLRIGVCSLNTELVKKPKDLLEYVVVHEMIHPIAPTLSDHFMALLTDHYPTWRAARAELDELPLTAQVWKE
jgi:predicted metal-dependent hydrolase